MSSRGNIVHSSNDLHVSISKIYAFIVKMVTLLEKEMRALESNNAKNAISDQKNMTETVNKLVTVITRLNKLSNQQIKVTSVMPEEDKKIIDSFLKKYAKRH